MLMTYLNDFICCRSFEKFGSVIDKNIFKQKLEETTAHENMLAKETTKILKNFASAKDKKGCIKVLQKRYMYLKK